MDGDAHIMAARLDALFAIQAAATADAPALIFRGAVVTYGQLLERVERLGDALSAHGVGPGVLVAVCLRRTPGMVAAILAILRAGGAYLPLDLRNPPERLTFVLADSGAGLLLTDCASPAWEGFQGTLLEVAEDQLIQRRFQSPPSPRLPPELAYVIYTSGSTGRPKGVMLDHGATHLVAWARRAYSDEERARVAATTSLCFDPSVLELFVPLCTGGAVVLKENGLEPFAADEQPTMLDVVPSVLAELCRADAVPASLRVLNVGGEALTAELVRQAFRRHPQVRLQNHYGPTEATTVATVAELRPDLQSDPPIGRPVRGAEIMVLDPDGHPVGEGERGEIHIGGPGLALGYLGRPELTAERFVTGPVGRLYRTGDLGAWRGGDLHFGGRADRQVKIRGFRVELGEIEAALMRLPGVEQAYAVMRDTGGRSEIVAWVQAPGTATAATVRRDLAAWLPDYMLPARLVVLPAFPLHVSGKLDHAALPSPDEASGPGAVRGARTVKPIIHVFQEVLGRACVGPDDSFFDLGGDSLASVQTALRLEELLGHEVPAALIHQAPSPRALARALDDGRMRADHHLSVLQPGGAGPPLFCLADLFGQPFNYLSLARRLAEDRTIYGLSPGPLQGAFTRDGDIGRLTDSFLDELRRVQPQGPYLIAGYSAGGLLAVDLACALERQGEAVRLVLLDSALHSRLPPAGAVLRWAWRRLRPGRLLSGARAAGGLLRDLARWVVRSPPPDWVPRSQAAFAASMIRAGAAYRPPAFRGPALLVVASEHGAVDQLFDHDGLLGWSAALQGEVTRVVAPGDHHQVMREPAVAETARAVRAFLCAQDVPLPSRAVP